MNLAVYVHIPFCRQRCSYCDFNTWAGLDRLIEPYTAALASELLFMEQSHEPWQASTLYFGGGTPSLVPAGLLHDILSAVPLRNGAEISLEANPGTLTPTGLLALRRLGINRLSLGVQSADDDELRLLGRLHDFSAVVDTVRWARAAGLKNQSLDLIYGLPGQNLPGWQHTIGAALALDPSHLSLYALTVEPGTPLARWIEHGRVPEPDPDLAADMYDFARERLAAAGYQHYEISNWCLPGQECRHNLAYWRNLAYLGFGAGAWGHWPQGQTAWRMRNIAHPQAYLDRLQPPYPEANTDPSHPPVSPACAEQEITSSPLAMAETMFMGLRLVQEGVSRAAFQARFGRDLIDVYAQPLADLARTGLVEWDSDAIRLTSDALLIGNQVFAAFLPDDSAAVGEGAAKPRVTRENVETRI
jgi:oxygen-independent coproporphyrinogen-3 oxidase